MRSSKGNYFTRQKHIPSGIIIVYQGQDGKIHTQSIAIQYPLWGKERSFKQTLFHARTELIFKQMDTWGVRGQVLPTPMITQGLTRKEAKQAYLIERTAFLPPHTDAQILL